MQWRRLIVLLVLLIWVGINVSLYLRAHLDLFVAIRQAYAWNTVWFPGFLIIVAASLYIVRRRPGETWVAPSFLAIAAILAGSRVWATHIEPRWLAVRRFTIHSGKVRRPVTIAHLSDIQSPAVGQHEERALATTSALGPDLFIHTGDLLQPIAPATHRTELARMAALFDRLPTVPKLNVMGDTDGHISKNLRAGFAGTTMLEDRAIIVEVQGSPMQVLGLSLAASHDPTRARPLVTKWIEATDSTVFRLVIGHAPDYILGIHDLAVDLALAGHTHGGQIRIPWVGPLLTLSQVPREWALGLHQVGNVPLLVSAGVGAEHAAGLPSIRVNCRPEIVAVDIVP